MELPEATQQQQQLHKTLPMIAQKQKQDATLAIEFLH